MLINLKGGEAQAVEALDHPDPAGLVQYRREKLQHGNGSSQQQQQWRKYEEAYLLTEKIMEGLRNLGTEGGVLGSGLYVGTGLRQDIPSELWASAKFDFMSGRVLSGKFEYHAVNCGSPRVRSLRTIWTKQFGVGWRNAAAKMAMR